MTGGWVAALLAALALVPVAARERAEVTPVQKVVQLMTGMVEKGKKEKNEEQIQFAAFKQFCGDTTTKKTRAIKEENEMIDMLQADISKYDSEAAQLGREIAQHDDDISTWEGDIKAATKVRDIENADYIATHKDYTESITALEDGSATLKGQNHNTVQASAALLQIASLPLMPEEGKRIMHSFLQRDPENDSLLQVTAPEANAYEFQSGALVDMLDKLAIKFTDERTQLEKEETAARQAFELLSQDLKMQIEQGTAARTEKQEAKSKALQAAADAKGGLSDTTTTRDDDSKYLSDLTAECADKSSAFEERQELRAEEITAIEKAIEILSSDAVSGASEKHLPQFVQVTSSLAQLRQGAQNPAMLRVAAYLKAAGSRLNSRVLSTLATHVTDDPFKKVKKMIKDLIVKLMEEANEEAEHKGWCDTELATNEHTRKEKTEAVEILHAEIDELTASVTQIDEEITELNKAVADLDAAVMKATEIREQEKAKNIATVEDAKAAQTAVAQALAVLKEFYEKAGDATALVQQEPEKPEVFSDEPYKGNQAAAGGIIGMIEVIQSDFARLEAETMSAEAAAQKEYDNFMKDSAVDKTEKSKDIEHKSGKKQNQQQAMQEKKKDLDGTQTELDAALEYFEKLKPSCMDAGESYEDRVARRKEEIESLQEALRILAGEDVA